MRLAIVVAVLGAVLSVTVVALHASRYRTLTALDELQHADYLYKVAQGSVVRRGDRYGQSAMREAACRGIDYRFQLPPCHLEVPYQPTDFPETGYNTADIHPPTYYAITAWLGRVGQLVTGEPSLVTAGRWVGGLWLASGLFLLWLVLARFDVAPLVRVVVILLLGSTPSVVHATATVNPDATAIFAGSLMLLATRAFEQASIGSWSLGAAAAVSVALKWTNALAVGVCVVYLLIRSHRHPRGDLPSDSIEGDREATTVRPWRGVLAIILGVALSVGIWLTVHTAIQKVSVTPMIQRLQVAAVEPADVLGEMTSLVTPVRDAYVPRFLLSRGLHVTAILLDSLIIGATLGVLLLGRWAGPASAVALSGLAGMVVGGMAMTLANYFLNSGIFVHLPPRYGISLLPLLGLSVALALNHRVVVWGAALLAIAAGLSIAYGLLL